MRKLNILVISVVIKLQNKEIWRLIFSLFIRKSNILIVEDECNARKELAELLENQGYTFEGAEASVDIMLRRVGGGYKPPFEVIDFRVITENQEGRGLYTEATVKIHMKSLIRFKRC